MINSLETRNISYSQVDEIGSHHGHQMSEQKWIELLVELYVEDPTVVDQIEIDLLEMIEYNYIPEDIAELATQIFELYDAKFYVSDGLVTA